MPKLPPKTPWGEILRVEICPLLLEIGELWHTFVFTRESSYCFQRILAIAILSIRLPVTRVDQSKMVQARITKSSPSAAWKTLVSGTVKLFHKFKGGHPNEGAK